MMEWMGQTIPNTPQPPDAMLASTIQRRFWCPRDGAFHLDPSGYLAEPEFRRTLQAADAAAVSKKAAGRVTEGTVFHCYHGGHEVPQEVVEWRPFDRMVTHDSVKVMGATIKLYSIFDLAPIEGGTHMTVTFGGLTGPKLQAALARRSFPGRAEKATEDGRSFKERIEADYRERVGV